MFAAGPLERRSITRWIVEKNIESVTGTRFPGSEEKNGTLILIFSFGLLGNFCLDRLRRISKEIEAEQLHKDRF